MKILKAIFAASVALAVLITPQSNAGEVIDYLPEILLARSFDVYNMKALGIGDSLEEVCFDDDPGPEIPEHIVINEHGLYKLELERLESIVAVGCQRAFFDAGQLNPLPILLGDSVETTVFIRDEGEISEFATFVDGNKQSNRVRASLDWYIFFAQLREFDVQPFIMIPNLLPENPCETFRGWVLNAPTFELQWASFQILMFDQISVDGGPNVIGIPDRVCTSAREGTVDELRAAAEAGDLDSALALSWIWFGGAGNLWEARDQFEGTEQAKFIDAEIERIELMILENTARYPLVTLAAIYPLSRTYLADRLFHGEEQ